MDGASHCPHPNDRAFVGARSVDFGGGQSGVASPEAEPSGAGLLCLDARDVTRDLGRILGAGRPMEELRRGPKSG
jgi:hypothetical protein